jgi:hypothetical protein
VQKIIRTAATSSLKFLFAMEATSAYGAIFNVNVRAMSSAFSVASGAWQQLRF